MTFPIYIIDGVPTRSGKNYKPYIDTVEYLELSDSLYPDSINYTEEKIFELYNSIRNTSVFSGSMGLKKPTGYFS